MIDDRIKEIQGVITQLQAELDLLQGQSGKVIEFIKQARSDGSFPEKANETDAATIIDLWEKFKSAKA